MHSETYNPDTAPRLYEHDKQEWWEIMRLVKHSITPEEFDVIWLEFQEEKLARQKTKNLN